MLVSLLITPASAYSDLSEGGVYSGGDPDAMRALELINELVRIEMLEEVYESKGSAQTEVATLESQKNQVKECLIDLGVEELTFDEAMIATGNFAAVPQSEYPLPSDRDNMTFYSINYTTSAGQVAYCLIATPIINSDHPAIQLDTYSANSVSEIGNTFDDGISTLVNIYSQKIKDAIVDGVVSTLPPTVQTILSWLPYEMFENFYNGSSTGQINGFDMFIQTRTVTQFVYLKNNANEPVFYGSTNCVHYATEQTIRKFAGSNLVSDTQNSNGTIYAENYLTYPDYCIPSNTTGYGVTPMYSFVNNVHVIVGNTLIMSINTKTYEQLIQVIT